MDQQLMLISGSQTFFVCVFQPPFVFIFCMHFLNLKGLYGICGKDKKKFMMFDFFKSNRNLEDNSTLVIPPKLKPIPFSVISSNGNKIESNFDFNKKKG
jgi:hypothetical protein